MLLHIKHVTRYLYDRAVFCEPLTIRLRPRDDPQQEVRSSDVRFDPEPAGASEFLDAAGNRCRLAWFSGTTTRLAITSQSMVYVRRDNPFAFLILERGLGLPVDVSSRERALCSAYLEDPTATGEVVDLARRLAAETGQRSLDFALLATEWIQQHVRYVHRSESPPQAADETLRLGAGACRDVAVLLCALCRSAGLPARFVSGYALADGNEPGELHAWTEVYLPGAGWFGLDPTTGLAVDSRYVALAAGQTADDAAPTSGAFRGSGAAARLETQVVMREVVDDYLPETRLDRSTPTTDGRMAIAIT